MSLPNLTENERRESAEQAGAFWLPCPRCGRMWGGNEPWRGGVECEVSLGFCHGTCCEGSVHDNAACARVHERQSREAPPPPPRRSSIMSRLRLALAWILAGCVAPVTTPAPVTLSCVTPSAEAGRATPEAVPDASTREAALFAPVDAPAPSADSHAVPDASTPPPPPPVDAGHAPAVWSCGYVPAPANLLAQETGTCSCGRVDAAPPKEGACSPLNTCLNLPACPTFSLESPPPPLPWCIVTGPDSCWCQYGGGPQGSNASRSCP